MAHEHGSACHSLAGCPCHRATGSAQAGALDSTVTGMDITCCTAVPRNLKPDPGGPWTKPSEMRDI